MNKLVMDNSVLIKLFVEEKGREEVKEIIDLVSEGEMELFCPEFLLVELINVLKSVKKLTGEKIKEILSELLTKGITIEPFDYNSWPDLLDLMEKYDLTAYDALYLWLAKEERCKLLTADKQLLKIKKYCVSLEDFDLVN
ncbi:type II toxin-antitoxin system VapC family toxin [Patescibacteria group bacterium]|nr:type II toxin-antitoxin system VapC family toxin [Patescibacteria group bacterium]